MSKKIEVSDETYEKIKGQLGTAAAPREIDSLDDLIGHSWFSRTVTYHCVGRAVKKLPGSFIVLEDASWVAESGRFHNAIKDGTLSEVEPVGQMLLNLETVVDISPWVHPLPTQQK